MFMRIAILTATELGAFAVARSGHEAIAIVAVGLVAYILGAWAMAAAKGARS